MLMGMLSLRVTKSRDVSAASSNGWVSAVSSETTSNPLAHATQSFERRKSIEVDSAGT